jgi:8-oxo-dGTP pyrophosphatase MutT (NUDIX family)
MNNRKIVYENEWFDVIDIDGWLGIEPRNINVIVMPYTRDDNGMIDKIGVRSEKNPMRSKLDITLITGDVDDADSDIMATAIRETNEESGYNVEDFDRWTYLGLFTNSKLVKQEQPCFAVDITGLTQGDAIGDGSKHEEESSFSLVSVGDALLSTDVYIPAVFVRAFNYIVNTKGTSAPADETK